MRRLIKEKDMRKWAATDGRQLYREFRDHWEKVQRKVEDLDESKRGSAKAVSQYVLVPFINRGIELSRFVLENKAVPSNKAKSLEMATRAFLSVRRAPRKPKTWVEKKRRRVEFLLKTEDFPEKQMGGEQLFELGPFKIHNTVGAEGKELELIKDLIRKATKFIGKTDVPEAKSLLYGDIYLVGRLQQAHTMAWYNRRKDNISLRVRKNIGSDAVHYLIHEFGHRLWDKSLDKSKKQNWSRWHGRCQYGSDDMPLPDVGDPLGFDLKGLKDPVIQKIEGLKFYVTDDGYLTLQQIRDAYVQEFAYPSQYAATDREEHFCEAFGMYAMGVLGSDHEQMFTKLIVRGQDIDD